MYYYRQYTLVRIFRVSVRFEICCLIHVFESRRKAFVRQFSKGSFTKGGRRRVVRCKMATRPSPEIGEYWPKEARFRRIGEGKKEIMLFDARGRSKSSSVYTGQSQMARIVKGASRSPARKNFGKKKESNAKSNASLAAANSSTRRIVVLPIRRRGGGWEKENDLSREGEGERKSDGKLVGEKFYDR